MTAGRPLPARGSGLFTDLYELTMAQAYRAAGTDRRTATFSLFTRHLPPGWGYLVAAGLDDALTTLERFAFSADELAFLERTGIFDGAFLEHLARVRFTGGVRALPEGTLFFPDEPVLEVTAPVLEAQLVETAILNAIHYQSLVAGKAARCVEAAQGRSLVDFGLRRTHGADAGLRAARSSWIAGFDATSDVLAGQLYGIPVSGTMAHSFVETYEDELDAFRAFASTFPDRSVLLVDTYDTLEGVRRAAQVGRELAEHGHRLVGIRLDSGDLGELARSARAILDDAGLRSTTIFASGGLDEHDVHELLAAGAPIDGFGIGSRLGTAADAPYLDMAYKLVEFDGRPALKLSVGKATLPGAKQVWRRSSRGGLTGDVIGIATEPGQGEPLLVPVMDAGRRLVDEPLDAARARCAEQRSALPAACRTLAAAAFPVDVSEALADLRDRTVARRREHEAAAARRS